MSRSGKGGEGGGGIFLITVTDIYLCVHLTTTSRIKRFSLNRV